MADSASFGVCRIFHFLWEKPRAKREIGDEIGKAEEIDREFDNLNFYSRPTPPNTSDPEKVEKT